MLTTVAIKKYCKIETLNNSFAWYSLLNYMHLEILFHDWNLLIWSLDTSHCLKIGWRMIGSLRSYYEIDVMTQLESCTILTEIISCWFFQFLFCGEDKMLISENPKHIQNTKIVPKVKFLKLKITSCKDAF